MKKAVLGVLLIALSLGFLFWRYSANLFQAEEQDKEVKLIYWGLFDEEITMRPLIEAYQKANPKIKINFVNQSLLNYRTRLQTQLQAGQGPDIFKIHSSWIMMLFPDLASASNINFNDYSQTFYPLAKDTLTVQNKIYALPLEIDGIAMYYNEDILQAAGLAVPKNWQEFLEAARKVTVRDQGGQIQTSGAALGTTNNVDYWPEILALLFLQQPNGSLESPASRDGAEVLQFYTSFVIDPKNKTWDSTLPSSTRMFTEGKLAFYFASFRKAQAFKEANPNLHFKTATVPQLPGKNVSLGGFWAEAVSKRSSHQKEAWDFLNFLSSSEALRFVHNQRTENGLLSKPLPRTDLAGILTGDPALGSFIVQAPYYKGWYLNSDTQDAGINEEMMKVFGGAVNGVLQGQSPENALQSISGAVKDILNKYKPLPAAKR